MRLFLHLGVIMETCSFFEHRDTKQTEELEQKVKEIVERLIVEEGVDTFLFGSRSKFDELCHIVVTELQKTYPNIRRIAYLCKHETGCLVGAGTSLKQKIKDLTGRDEYVGEYEEIKKSSRVDSAGRASYVERNQFMIQDSDYCIFYFQIQSSLSKQQNSKHKKNDNKKRSGTMYVYEYALQQKNRNKIIEIMNLCR